MVDLLCVVIVLLAFMTNVAFAIGCDQLMGKTR
jgi:hypothetical protein